MPSDVTVALIGVIAVAVGWLVLHRLEQSREDRRRRLEKRLEYATRQIEEFYGPLFNLVHQVFLANHVQQAILEGANASGNQRLSGDQKKAVLDYFQREHFGRLHEEINSILKHKLHLVRGTDMPQSFYDYLLHALQERDQRQLWEQAKVDTSFIKGVPWPQCFHEDLRNGLAEVMADYEDALRGLRRK
jgi:hypothetical protein